MQSQVFAVGLPHQGANPRAHKARLASLRGARALTRRADAQAPALSPRARVHSGGGGAAGARGHLSFCFAWAGGWAGEGVVPGPNLGPLGRAAGSPGWTRFLRGVPRARERSRLGSWEGPSRDTHDQSGAEEVEARGAHREPRVPEKGCPACRRPSLPRLQGAAPRPTPKTVKCSWRWWALSLPSAAPPLQSRVDRGGRGGQRLGGRAGSSGPRDRAPPPGSPPPRGCGPV